MNISLTEFDDISNGGNTHPIHLVMHEIKLTAPAGAKVNWEYPGYISIVLSNGTEIAFGGSLESESGYTWNSYDINGTSEYCNSFDDLKDIKEIAKELWNQAALLLKSGE
jgi:hypothetical protein